MNLRTNPQSWLLLGRRSTFRPHRWQRWKTSCKACSLTLPGSRRIQGDVSGTDEVRLQLQGERGPFNITAIYHDDRFTYIKSGATEKFTVYEVRDGAPNLINYELRDGTYTIAKMLDKGYVEIGKKRMEFTRKVQP